MSGVFSLANISKSYGVTRAVGPIELEIPARATTVLIGPSGCGKSTLLRLMTGLTFSDTGEIRFNGGIIGPENWATLRPKLGYVIQEGGLFPHLDARANVSLMARYLRLPPKAIEDRLTTLLQLTQLDRAILSRFPAELSGGQRQRISLMRALMLNPEVLLLDEPLGALDPMTRFDLQNDLLRIFQSLGKTVVLVTHDLAEAAFLGDRIVLMRDGKVVQSGTLSHLAGEPAEPFVQRFINAQRSPLDAALRPA